MEFWDLLSDLFTSRIVIGTLNFPFTLLDLLLRFVLPIGVGIVAYRLILAAFRKIAAKSKSPEETKRGLLRWTRIILRVLFLVLLIGCVSWLFGAEIFRYVGMFFTFLSSPIIHSGGTTISIITIILLIPAVYISTYAGKRVSGIVNRTLASRENLDESKRFTLSRLLSYLAMVLVFIFSLSILGIDLSVLTVLFGVLGIGLGFGLQNVVANFFAGIVILFTRPIKEGDRILVEEQEGTVVQVRLLSSIINTLMEESIIGPNSTLVNNTVRNYTYGDRTFVIPNTVQVSYGSDLDQVLAVLDEVGRRNPFGIEGKDPFVRVSSFDDSGITMSLYMYIRDVTDKWAAISWNNLEIWRAFKNAGIEIPFPQVDVHMKDQPAPADGSARSGGTAGSSGTISRLGGAAGKGGAAQSSGKARNDAPLRIDVKKKKGNPAGPAP